MAASPKTRPAVAHEALGEPVPFEYRGESYLALPSSEWPLDALESYEEGKVIAFLKAVLPGDGWATLKSTGAKAGDLEEFLGALQKALGIAGN